ncbi:CBU_0592 family membrane protein [Nitrolancea hollandica]|uniref:CBU-0592-like domain-containing protein n=1 Tax=Nitrolancea hollandica Lb TaxID=1129897 RepID=I4ECX9_9BACT|nr:hypothetical protein [Nitrolancea hollandica]CCF82541.1 conserved membrane hypothetical protein [Nitrolancea hollandica Lb]
MPVIQIIAVIGSLAILAAYGANQAGWIGPLNLKYTLLNAIGSGILAVVAVIERQWGFLLLEAVWVLVSIWGTLRILRGGGKKTPSSKPSA